MTWRRSGCAATAALLLALVPAGATAQEPGEAAEIQAEATLEEALELFQGPAPARPTRELTPVLAELARSAPALDRRERRVARSILTRPDDGRADRYGDGFRAPEADESPLCDTNFCVHWVDTTSDAPPSADTNGDEIPNYVEEVAEAADRSADVENGTLGWRNPVPDGPRGGGMNRTDIYLLETRGDYFGYASPDEGQGTVAEKESYLVLDEDMQEFIDPPGFTATEALQVTMAHEYNHVLQFAYDSLQDSWMFESTATWAEEQVYPSVDDYLGYVPSFARTPRVPLTKNDPSGLKIYGAAVWNHYLSSVYGDNEIREAWAVSDQVFPAHHSAAAYDRAIGGGGNPFEALGDEFIRFASSTVEWRALPRVFPDADELPTVDRVGTLRPRRTQQIPLDHLSYALFDVPPKLGTDFKVLVSGPPGTHFGIDLVGRTGTASGGTVTSSPISDDDGGRLAARLPERDYDRITAVVVNADPRISSSGEYLRKNQRFHVKLLPR